MKKIFIFFIIMLFSPVVFAKDFTISSKVMATTSSSKGTYKATEIYNTGTSHTYSINTRYDGQLSYIEFYLDSDDWDWDYNTTYTITLNMATSDWRNHFGGPQVWRTNSDGSIPSTATNFYTSGTFQFISMKKIKFNFKTGSTMGIYTKFVLPSSNVSSTAFTGVSNWNLSSIIISTISNPTPTPAPVTPRPATPTPRPATPTPRPDSTNQDIINNQNNNTQSIINNQNNNTQSIINNQNNNTSTITNNQNNNTQSIIDSNTQNTSDIIENNNSNTEQIIDNQNSNQTCPVGPLRVDYINFSSNLKDKKLNSNGSIGNEVSRSVSVYFSVKGNTEYHFDYGGSSYSGSSFCFYSNNQTLISCLPHSNENIYFITPSDAVFIRFTLGANRPFMFYGPVCNDWQSEKQDTTNEKLNDINDSINNSSIDNKGSFFSDFEDNTHGLTGIITLPLTTIQSLSNNSCVPLSIPIPFTNSNVSLPCMREVYQTYIPSVYSVWQVVSFGIISYFICLDIFKMVKGFKDPNEDKIEVLDL